MMAPTTYLGALRRPCKAEARGSTSPKEGGASVPDQTTRSASLLLTQSSQGLPDRGLCTTSVVTDSWRPMQPPANPAWRSSAISAPPQRSEARVPCPEPSSPGVHRARSLPRSRLHGRHDSLQQLPQQLRPELRHSGAIPRGAPWPKKLSAASLSQVAAKAFTAFTAMTTGVANAGVDSTVSAKRGISHVDLPSWPLTAQLGLSTPGRSRSQSSPRQYVARNCSSGSQSARDEWQDPLSRLRWENGSRRQGTPRSPSSLRWPNSQVQRGRPSSSQLPSPPPRGQMSCSLSPLRWGTFRPPSPPRSTTSRPPSPPRWGTIAHAVSSRSASPTSSANNKASVVATPRSGSRSPSPPRRIHPSLSPRQRWSRSSSPWRWSKLTSTSQEPLTPPSEEDTHKYLVDVFLRVRPQNLREKGEPRGIKVSRNSICVNAPLGPGRQWFDFEDIIDSSSGSCDQVRVFEALGEQVVQSVLDGFHTCVFSLGQTGTGKTYTLLGTPEEPGLLPRLVNHLLMQKQRGHLSCLELHMDRVRDLLSCSGVEQPVPEIRCIPHRGVYVSNMNDVPVVDAEAALKLIHMASRNRVVARTCMNSVSSRGHSVYQLRLESGARLCVVDLAGRESERNTHCRGQSLAELGYINKSLFHLTNVIQALAATHRSRSPSARVPFRDSKLTLLLSEYLQSARTFLMVTVSPAASSIDETLTTLRLAQAVRQITTQSQRAGGSSLRRNCKISCPPESWRVSKPDDIALDLPSNNLCPSSSSSVVRPLTSVRSSRSLQSCPETYSSNAPNEAGVPIRFAPCFEAEASSGGSCGVPSGGSKAVGSAPSGQLVGSSDFSSSSHKCSVQTTVMLVTSKAGEKPAPCCSQKLDLSSTKSRSSGASSSSRTTAVEATTESEKSSEGY